MLRATAGLENAAGASAREPRDEAMNDRHRGARTTEHAPNSPRRLRRAWLTLALAAATSAPLDAKANEPLPLHTAVARGLARYQRLAAKKDEVGAAHALATNARNAYLPDVTAAVQQSYGTVNGAFGPQTPIGLQGIASAGPTAPAQSWNSGFGANYLLAANWEFLTFGRVDARIDLADAQARRAGADLAQETFVHGVKVAGAYLELLAQKQLARVAESNLERTATVQQNVRARADGGLVPEVDRSMADAEVSRAKLTVIETRDREQALTAQLAVFIDTPSDRIALDGSLLARRPARFATTTQLAEAPQVKFQEARIDEAAHTKRAIARSILPGLNLVGAFHARAGGFDHDYAPAFPERHTQSYFGGVVPDRANYVVGLTLAWNLMSPLKIREQVRAQSFGVSALRNERALVLSQLQNDARLADQRIQNARETVDEVPLQYDAAEAAYRQKVALYENGLATLVEVQQVQYALARADADRSVANLNLWRALLQKAAATGDFALFLDQARAP